jgi:Ca-activated chloride channel family protein
MNPITFDYPLVLMGLAVFFPLTLYDHFSVRKKLILKNLPKNLKLKLSVSRLAFKVFLGCVIIALAGPRWGMGETVSEYRRTVDAVIALDVSRSMEVPDGQEANGDLVGDLFVGRGVSRMERGISIVGETIAALPGIRYALALSRNRGIVALPLTWDNGAVFAFLDAIGNVDEDAAGTVITGRGTNLESLLDAAAGAFQSSYPSSRAILLVSDGEALSGTLRAALERCNQNGITVVALALGSDEGGIVPGEDAILSRRDSAAMRMAAGQTGGIYIDGNREDASRILTAHLRSLGLPFMEGTESDAKGNKKEHKARWLVFVIMAIMSFGVSKLSLLKLGKVGE